MTKAPNAFPRNMGGVRGNYSEIPNSSNGGQMAGHGRGQYRTTTEGCPYGKNRQSMGCRDKPDWLDFTLILLNMSSIRLK